jgi:hypothetical protein
MQLDWNSIKVRPPLAHATPDRQHATKSTHKHTHETPHHPRTAPPHLTSQRPPQAQGASALSVALMSGCCGSIEHLSVGRNELGHHGAAHLAAAFLSGASPRLQVGGQSVSRAVDTWLHVSTCASTRPGYALT